MAPPGCRKTPQELLTGVKPSVGHLWSFGCKDWAGVPDTTRKALDLKVRCGFLLQCISYRTFGIMLEHDQIVETTRHCLLRENVFPMNRWKNVV